MAKTANDKYKEAAVEKYGKTLERVLGKIGAVVERKTTWALFPFGYDTCIGNSSKPHSVKICPEATKGQVGEEPNDKNMILRFFIDTDEVAPRVGLSGLAERISQIDFGKHYRKTKDAKHSDAVGAPTPKAEAKPEPKTETKKRIVDTTKAKTKSAESIDAKEATRRKAAARKAKA